MMGSGKRLTPGDHSSLQRGEISVDPGDRSVADAQSIGYSTAPKLSTRRVITGFAPPEQRTAEQAAAGSLWRPGATKASLCESAAAWDCVAEKLCDEMLQSPHRLQLRWEGDSGVPGVVSVMQCGYRQCHGPQFPPCVQKSRRSGHYLPSRGAHSS